ncbi:MAG: hypothetical protein WCP70_13885 [Methanothrix sp.]
MSHPKTVKQIRSEHWIEDTNEQINTRVYELCGLTGREIRIVEEIR